MKKLYFITGNPNKLREVKAIIPDIEGLDISLQEIQSLDPFEIVRHKLMEAQKHHEGNLIVDDSSLVVKCLNKLPGTLIKFFEESIGLEGIVKIAKLFEDTSATARCIIGLSYNGKIELFEGKVEGKIVSLKGNNGFGWDKIFVPDGHDKTYAEMPLEEKNKISHRHLALEKLKKYLEKINL
ncbi:RdgB/HAM1 family non-canonical purine NTP pyrophosphatase [Candidatus Woesearchaeota archaeon]|nr:RdgB/HAM1 family non-canonical purine NTP pyrophosphatase [Candidatus Woesearchaeota archaeon]